MFFKAIILLQLISLIWCYQSDLECPENYEDLGFEKCYLFESGQRVSFCKEIFDNALYLTNYVLQLRRCDAKKFCRRNYGELAKIRSEEMKKVLQQRIEALPFVLEENYKMYWVAHGRLSLPIYKGMIIKRTCRLPFICEADPIENKRNRMSAESLL